MELIAANQGMCVVEHLDSFKNLDHTKIVIELVLSNQAWIVNEHLDSFRDLDYKTLALTLFESSI